MLSAIDLVNRVSFSMLSAIDLVITDYRLLITSPIG